MNTFKLSSKRDAELVLTKLLMENKQANDELPNISLQVREDKCFGESWVDIGRIKLFPELPDASKTEEDDSLERVRFALRYGFFQWKIPSQNEISEQIERAFSAKIKEKNNPRQKMRIAESAKSIAHIAIRCGLANPVFDALTLEIMQFRRPISVIVDTNAVLQGGLDFFAKHVLPTARIKVPALVHMEIINFVDRYFSQRNKESYTPTMLLDHLCGQGGQRVLLRLETNENVEFERPKLGADPLRGVVTNDSDAEDKSLGLQRVQRSFADRLILETAIQHREQVAPDHQVMLLTGDQGLARMSLAEGLQPIFFDSNAALSLFDRTLSGINFVPFSNEGPKFHSTSLVELLWEFAAAFGTARVSFNEETAKFEVLALGGEVAWQPYHSYEDLLWTRTNVDSNPEQPDANVGGNADEQALGEDEHRKNFPAKRGSASRESQPKLRKGSYDFNLNSMFRLVRILNENGTLTDQEGMELIKVGSSVAYAKYRNFLTAGNFAIRRRGRIDKTDSIELLYSGLTSADYISVRSQLAKVSSFRQFLERLQKGSGIDQEASELRRDVYRTYSNLAEICCAGVRLADKGIFGTPFNPGVSKFAEQALVAHELVRGGEAFALTGLWLEEMIARFGIHPVQARQRLIEAHQGGYIRRYFEGSTPETRFENRNIQVLSYEHGEIIVRSTNLYHGDFLMPGRASVSLKLLKGERT